MKPKELIDVLRKLAMNHTPDSEIFLYSHYRGYTQTLKIESIISPRDILDLCDEFDAVHRDLEYAESELSK